MNAETAERVWLAAALRVAVAEIQAAQARGDGRAVARWKAEAAAVELWAGVLGILRTGPEQDPRG